MRKAVPQQRRTGFKSSKSAVLVSAGASPKVIENVGEEADDSPLQLHQQKVLGQRGEEAGRQVSLAIFVGRLNSKL